MCVFLQRFLTGSEKYVGAHVSLFTVFAFYWLSCFLAVLRSYDNGNPSLSSQYLSAPVFNGTLDYNDVFRLGGLSGGLNNSGLLYAMGAAWLLTVSLWLPLVTGLVEPGQVVSRCEDFDKVRYVI